MNADRYIVPGLERGLRILQAFTPRRRALTPSEMAEVAGVSRSAIFRIAYTLEQLGFLVHDRIHGTYVLGPALLQLGFSDAETRRLVTLATPHLEALRDATGWSAHLGVREGRDVLYLLRLPASGSKVGIVHVGSRLPAHATTMGRMLLAQLGAEAIASLYRQTDLAVLDLAIPVTLAAVQAQADADRRRGHVARTGGFESHIASIAAPIVGHRADFQAAINISVAITPASGAAITSALIDLVLAASAAITASAQA